MKCNEQFIGQLLKNTFKTNDPASFRIREDDVNLITDMGLGAYHVIGYYCNRAVNNSGNSSG